MSQETQLEPDDQIASIFSSVLKFILLCKSGSFSHAKSFRCLALAICLRSLGTKKSNANIIYLLKDARDYRIAISTYKYTKKHSKHFRRKIFTFPHESKGKVQNCGEKMRTRLSIAWIWGQKGMLWICYSFRSTAGDSLIYSV